MVPTLENIILTSATFGITNNAGTYTPNANGDYNVSNLSYDPNGNILSLNRHKYSSLNGNAMDALQYHYDPNSNQLNYVTDTSGNTADDGDIKNQNPNNYVYNSIWQLIENKQDDIGYTYYATGLVKSVFSTVSNDPKKVEFFYNDRGHRVSKLTTLPNNTQQQTFYVGDASGSAMAIYNTSIGIGTEPSNNIEYPIYGLSRLGVADQGNIFKYQISDHLGNVRAVIQRDGSGTVVFHNDFNNTSTIPAGWVAGPNTVLSIDTTHDRLKASVSNVSNNSLARSFSVVAGHNYKINFKTDLDQTPNTLQYSINAIGGTGSGVYTTAVNGTYTFNYTAASNGTVTLLFKLLNSYGGISIQNNYFLDDVKVTDITTTNTPLMLAYKDYYPFGMPMPDRNVEGQYRYTYQGQEKDLETGMEAFEARLWDARIGRWLTVDPAGEFFSPYLGMGNNPISTIDPDGRCTTCPDNPNVGDSYNHPDHGELIFSKNGWVDTNGAGFTDVVITVQGNKSNFPAWKFAPFQLGPNGGFTSFAEIEHAFTPTSGDFVWGSNRSGNNGRKRGVGGEIYNSYQGDDLIPGGGGTKLRFWAHKYNTVSHTLRVVRDGVGAIEQGDGLREVLIAPVNNDTITYILQAWKNNVHHGGVNGEFVSNKNADKAINEHLPLTEWDSIQKVKLYGN